MSHLQCSSGMKDGRLVDFAIDTPGSGGGSGGGDGEVYPVYEVWDPFFAWGPGLDYPCASADRFRARLIDWVEHDGSSGAGSGSGSGGGGPTLGPGTYPVYEVWDYCHPTRPGGTATGRVTIDCTRLGVGTNEVSTSLLARISVASNCPALDCTPSDGGSGCDPEFVEGTLTGQAFTDGDVTYYEWTGTVGGIELTLRCREGVFTLHLPEDGCGVPVTSHGVACDRPFHYSISSLGVREACCNCGLAPDPLLFPATVVIDLLGYYEPRYPARLVDFLDGVPVYLATRNCPKTCEPKTCCGNNACDLHCSITALGDCGCGAVSFTLTHQSQGGFPWVNWPTFIEGCDGGSGGQHPIGATLRCLDPDEECSRFEFNLSCYFGCSGQTITESYCCAQEVDLEFEISLVCENCPPPFATTQCCCTEGSHSYLVRITR